MDITLPDIDSEKYKEIYKNVATKCKMVRKSEKGIIGCKSSQLIYIIIALLWNNISCLEVIDRFNPNYAAYLKKITDFSETVIRLYDICVDYTEPDIKGFSLNLKPIIPFIELDNTMFLDTRDYMTKIYTMGLVFTNNNNKDTHPDGVINHYFLIVNVGRKFYCISSYGSDVVSVPQKIVELNIREFQKIIDAFNGIGSVSERNRFITSFFNKYFLPDGIKKYSTDEESGKKLVLTPEEGARLEITDYLFNDSGFQKEYKFYYFPEFVNNVNQIILDNEEENTSSCTISGGKKIRTKKNKKSKPNRSKKHKKSRSKKTFRINKTSRRYRKNRK